MKVYIYGLYSTFSGNKEAPSIRYVGKTTNPEKRFMQHLSDCSECHKARWIRKEQAIGKEIKLLILETLENAATINWPAQECYWMEICAGNRITNSKAGGGALEYAPRKAKVPSRSSNLAPDKDTQFKLRSSYFHLILAPRKTKARLTKLQTSRALASASVKLARRDLGYHFHQDCEITFDDTVEKTNEMVGVSLFFQPPPTLSC